MRNVTGDDQPVVLVQLALDRGNKLAEQRIATAQMVVEETQGCTDREGMEPERDLGQLDGHEVLVDAVNASLQDHAADNVPVV